MERSESRPGFLVSAIVHLLILMALAKEQAGPRQPEETQQKEPAEVRQRVFLPPPPVLRQLAPAPPPPPPRPAPTPLPEGKDRVSIGGPSSFQEKGPLLLERDKEAVRMRKGTADGALTPAPPATPAPATPAPAPTPAAPLVADGTAGRAGGGLRLPPGLDRLPSGDDSKAAGPRAPISESLRDLDRRLQASGTFGSPTGTSQDIGGLHFDPQGADFSLWIERFRTEVYRNWIIPQPALMGFKGRVSIEFVVERDGRVSSVRIVQPSGTGAFDRAAQNALLGSRFAPLPPDYRPASVTMLATFYYNMSPTAEGA